MSDDALPPKLARAVTLLQQSPPQTADGRARLLEALAAERARTPVPADLDDDASIPFTQAPRRRTVRTWFVPAAVAAGFLGLAFGWWRSHTGNATSTPLGSVTTGVIPAASGTLGDTTPTAAGVDITAQAVDFVLQAPGAERVSVAGDFNNWNPAATPLERSANGELWTVRLPLVPGRYRYAFVVNDTTWRPDPLAPAERSDEYGATSVMVVRVRP